MTAEKQPAATQPSPANEYGTAVEAGTVRLERVLPGPIERVWAYLTESEKRGTWFSSGPMELRPGGKIEFLFENAKLTPYDESPPEKYKHCEGMTSTGRVIRCEPPNVLTFSWMEEYGDESEVTFELAARGKDVLMVLTHRRLRNRSDMIGVAAGWHAHVGILIDKLNGRQPKPFWATHLKLEEEYDQRFPPE
jgi:uncharacterized protein YndB with AHSA1/START domain